MSYRVGQNREDTCGLTLEEYAYRAQQVLDRQVWDFIEGGAGDERTVLANRQAFADVVLRPRVLAGVGEPVLSIDIFGRHWPTPIAVAPLAYHTMVTPDGELATVRGAGVSGTPVVVSTFAGKRFDELAAAASGPLWLQLYCFRDRRTTRHLIEQAEAAGFEALVLTVDAPRLGRRLRDLRNGFRLPAGVVPANLPSSDFASPSDHSRLAFDSALDWSVVSWLRSVSTLPVLVKGILAPADAERALAEGASGIIVSNHGGRQLDRAPASFEVLPEIAAATAGRCPLLVDGGIRRGSDVLAAVALGADAVLLGRPVLHGLAVGGGEGVAEVLGIVAEELVEAMLMTGTATLADAGPALVASTGRSAAPAPAAAPRLERPSGALALRKRDLHQSLSDPVLDTMNFLNEITDRYPDAISFAPGRPYEEFYDLEQVFDYVRRYVHGLAEQGMSKAQVVRSIYQYGPAAGQIREVIAQWLREDEGIDVPAESLVVTVGCQEAMFLVLRALFARPEDVLLVSSPCYVGLTGAASLLDIDVLAIEEGDQGFSGTAVEDAVRRALADGRRPRALYVVPDHSNPSGNTMSLAARAELLELAGRHGILLLEDSPYRLVSPGERLPSLKALDREHRVIHLGSFSKTVFPGARVGFAVADQPVEGSNGERSLLADEIAKIKSMVTVNTSSLSQAAVAGALMSAGGLLSSFNPAATDFYANAMQLTVQALAESFPADRHDTHGVSWNEPSGGFFLTVRVPFRADADALARSAQRFGVVWTPMSYFHPSGGGEKALRLSVSYLAPERLTEGVARLVRFIRSELG